MLDLLTRGHRVLLAHPERSPSFQRDPARLARLVEAGVLVQVTAGSLTGGFGSKVRGFTGDLLRDGLAHVVASDAHDAVRPAASPASAVPGLDGLREWMTELVPRAILDGTPLPERPRGLRA